VAKVAEWLSKQIFTTCHLYPSTAVERSVAVSAGTDCLYPILNLHRMGLQGALLSVVGLASALAPFTVFSAIFMVRILIVPRVGRYSERTSGGAHYIKIGTSFVSKGESILELE